MPLLWSSLLFRVTILLFTFVRFFHLFYSHIYKFAYSSFHFLSSSLNTRFFVYYFSNFVSVSSLSLYIQSCLTLYLVISTSLFLSLTISLSSFGSHDIVQHTNKYLVKCCNRLHLPQCMHCCIRRI